MATVVTYDVGNGQHATVRTPPTGWSPADATSAELAYFHIPPKPAAGSALTAWVDEWVNHFSTVGSLVQCKRDAASLVSNTVYTSNNWSGQMALVSGVTEVYGHTTFDAGTTCGTTDDGYSSWVGIGGWNTDGHLIQNGFYSEHLYGSTPFWEQIGPGGDTGTVPVSFSWHNGDSVNMSVAYSTSGYGTATYSWHDLTTGALYSTSVDHSSGEYSGKYGEAIDEAPTSLQSHLPFPLRKYKNSVHYWSGVTVSQNHGALKGIRSIAHTGINMYDGQTPLSLTGAQQAGANSATSFGDYWKNCF